MLQRCLMSMLIAAIPLAIGCGETKSTSKTTSKKSPSNSAKESTAAAPKPVPAPPPKPKVVVPADAYAGVPQALQVYVTALKDQNATEVGRVEAWLEMNSPKSATALGEILQNPATNPEEQIAAGRALGRCGPAADKTLIEAINNAKVEQVRIKLIESLSLLKPPSGESVKALHGLMKHQDSRIRQHSIQALARIGKPAADVVPDLQAILNNEKENETVRGAAKDALKKIDPRKGFQGMKLDPGK